MNKYILNALLVVTGLSLTTFAQASEFDGAKPLICASIESVECIAGGDCRVGTAESIQVPQFLRVDFEGKAITADRADGSKLNTTITSVNTLADRTILQGIESDLGWSISIAKDTGKMSVSVSGNEIAFIVFGVCTVL